MKRSRLPLAVTVTVLLFFYVPTLVLVVDSFNASRFPGAWGGFSFRWYLQLAREREIWRVFRNSVVVAVAASAVSTVIGTAAAFALHRFKGRLQRFHYGLIYMPLVVPEILMGISLLLLLATLRVPLSLGTVFVAHVTFCISYVAMVVLSRLQDFDFTLVDAAMDLGAGLRDTVTRVMAPLLAPGIVAGALLALTLSLDDFVITFFVAGPGATTLPIHVYSMMKHGATPLINALSTLLLVVTAVVAVVAQRLAGGNWR